jgi:Putative transposase
MPITLAAGERFSATRFSLTWVEREVSGNNGQRHLRCTSVGGVARRHGFRIQHLPSLTKGSDRTCRDDPILFRVASETLRTIAADPEHLGAEIGFLGVLHTWGQSLTHHPHLQFLVPGGGIAPDGESWIPCRPGFVLPVPVLSCLFRGLFLHALEKVFIAGELNFFSAHRHLHEPAAFRRYLAPAWKVNCRVGGDVAVPTPHRPGRAGFPHPVLHERDSLAAA